MARHEELGDDGWVDPEALYQARRESERQRFDNLASANPYLDYYDHYTPLEPKREIGEYVASQGFSVPIMRSQAEWEAAFDADQAMLRSEHRQDYKGFAGLLASKVLLRNDWDFQIPLDPFNGTSTSLNQKFGELIREGLRSGELTPTDYMRQFCWNSTRTNPALYMIDQMGALGIEPLVSIFEHATASRWRYIPGVNLRLFRDPSVKGRYHVGSRTEFEGSWVIEPHAHNDRVIPYRGDKPVHNQELIDFYESVRSLPRFDQAQCPVIEAQIDESGKLHFLQYLKTGHRLRPVDEFALPDDVAARSSNVRGATTPDGEEMRLYIAPDKVTKSMRGQAIYFDGLHVRRGFAQQYFSMIGKAIVHDAYIGFRSTHDDSAPLYRPQVAMGLYGHNDASLVRSKLRELTALMHGNSIRDTRSDHNVYIAARITSNGRESALETDFVPQFESRD